MDLDPPTSAPGDACVVSADAWPFDSLTTSLLFSSVSASPPLPSLPANSSSWLTPPSPLWLFEDRHLLPLEAPQAPEAAVAAAVVEEVQRARSNGNSDTTSKRVQQINHKWHFNLSLDEDGTDNSSLFKEKLTQALRYFKDSTDQHLLVQVWAPVKNGDRYVLTTSGQPFVLDHQSIGLLQYRAVSMMYMFSIDGENVGELGLPGRVYKLKVPEWTPNVQYYSSTEYPRLNHAISYNVHGTVALPVFDPSAQSCIAVVELIMTSKKINYACEVDKVCKALEAVNLRSTEILDHPNVQICNEGRQTALVEILEILTVVCEEHKLPLAQTWVPCKYRSVLAHGGGLKKSCLSFDGSCMGEVIESVQGSDAAFNLTSITGPLPIPVGPSSDSLSVEKVAQSKVKEPLNLTVDGDRDSSLQKSLDNDGHFGVLMAQQGFIDNNNDRQLEADKASHSRSSSGEGSINSRTSEGSCQGSPANGTFVCKPIASTFTEPQLNPEEFHKETFQEPQLPLSRMLIEDSGSSKDLKNLFTPAAGQPFLAPPSNLASVKHSGTVTIKASFKDDIVRFRFPCSGSVTVLKDEVAKRLRMDVGTFDIKYLDDDHEWVKLACNADLEECMEISRNSGSHVIRLLVSDIAAHLGSSCGSSG
nr:unnamed protein product [Digitaria exilis]